MLRIIGHDNAAQNYEDKNIAKKTVAHIHTIVYIHTYLYSIS